MFLLNIDPDLLRELQNPHYAIAPLVVAGIIAAAGSIISGIIKGKSDKNANEQQREYNDMAYGRQRSDALADWNMQTEYNSPTSQMARMRQAGLNPILAAGNITSSSPSVRSTDYNSYTPKSVDYSPAVSGATSNISDSLLASYNVQQREAQTDNLKAQNTVLLEEAILKRAQTLQLLSSTEKTKVDTSAAAFGLTQNMRLADTQFEAASANLTKTKNENEIALQANERAEIQTVSNLSEAVERILKMRADRAKTASERAEIQARINNIKADTKLKDLDYELRRKNINPGDNMFNRTLQRVLDDTGITVDGSLLKGAQRFSHKVDSTANSWWQYLKNKSTRVWELNR